MNELVKAPAAAAVMHKAVLARDPETNTEAALSRLAGFSLKAVLRHKLVFPTDPKTGEQKGWREVMDRCELVAGPNADLMAGQGVLSELLAPASDNDIQLWLVELSTITARRSEGAEDAALTLVAYTSRLNQYPGDIVRQTLKDWSGKWFPTWGELKEILDARVAPRLAIQHALIVQAAGKTLKRIPDLDGLSDEQKYERLQLAARHLRRTDPDGARELEQEALQYSTVRAD